jgi:uncharacterized integral membrane protein
MFTGKQLAAIILVILCLILLVQNSRLIDVNFLFFHPALPLSLLILIVLLMGVLLGYWLNRRKRTNARK